MEGGAIVHLFQPYSDIKCNLEVWLMGFGAVLAIGAPLLKTYRVVTIYEHALAMKRSSVTDKQMFAFLSPMVFGELIICSLYTTFHQMNGGVEDKQMCAPIFFLPKT